MVAALAVMMVFSLIAGVDAGFVPVLVTLAIFFILPAIYLSFQEKQFRKAKAQELDRLMKQDRAPPTGGALKD